VVPGTVLALTGAGAAVLAGMWLLIRAGRLSIWTGSAAVNGLLAALALLTERVRGGGRYEVWPAALLGLGAGVVLYAATAAFMSVAGRWPPLRWASTELYERRDDLPATGVVGLAAGVVAPAEEVFWRGLVQGALAAVAGPLGGAALAWGAYVAVNAVSGSLPIVLGAAVGGAAWAGLAWWTGGVVASAACHAVWTALMIVRPPIPKADR
jgi:CAAX protease family protein